MEIHVPYTVFVTLNVQGHSYSQSLSNNNYA